MLNMRKPILSLVGLLAVASLIGCQEASRKKEDSKELSQEQIIDKGLEAFEHLKNGKIHMEDEVVKVVNEPEEGEEKNATVKTSFDGSFELRPTSLREILEKTGHGIRDILPKRTSLAQSVHIWPTVWMER